MRTQSMWLSALLLVTLAAVAQEQKAVAADAASPTVVEKGPHHRVWSRTTTQALPDGRTVDRKHSYTEVGTGLHYRNEFGEWTESKAEVELFQDGARARQGQHQVIFGNNLNSAGVIDLLTPEGKRLRSHILGLAFTDAASGQSVLIAEPKDSIGELLAPNKVIYREAFDGPFHADVVFLYTRGGFEQFVILTTAPPSPSEYGLSPDSTLLEVWTEFIDAPEPVKRLTVLREETDPVKRQTMAAPDFTDEFLDFGAMCMPMGTAFPMEGNQLGELENDSTPTGKSWLKLDQRTFLVEKVEYAAVKNQLDQLPQAAAVLPRKKANAMMAAKGAGPQRPFPRGPKQVAALDKKPLQMASLSLPSKGFVLDYTLLTTVSNFTFRGDTTYYVSNSAVILSGEIVIEGGSVVKYSQHPSVNRIQFLGSIDCRTSPWRPAFFVAADDNTVGDIIAGSSGNPGANRYALLGVYPQNTGQTNVLHDLRIRNAERAVYTTSTSKLLLENIQIRNANYAFNANYPFEGRNLLVESCTNGFGLAGTATARLEHVTFHLIKNFNGTPTNVFLTNCLIIAVTNSVAFSGDNNVTNLCANDQFVRGI